MNTRSRIRSFSRSLVKDTRGANMVEYVILVGVIAVLALAMFRAFGSAIRDKVTEQTGTVSGVEGREQ